MGPSGFRSTGWANTTSAPISTRSGTMKDGSEEPDVAFAGFFDESWKLPKE
jgi:hypothetical protein